MAPTELVALRRPEAKHFVRDDGSRYAEIGSELHYRDASGQLADVDLAFRADPATGGSVSDRHRLKSRVYREAPNNWIEIVDESGRGIRFRAPAQPAAAGRRASFQNAGFEWAYILTKGGLRLQVLVNATQGRRSYAFDYETVGGASPLTLDATGNLVSGNLLVIPRPSAFAPNGSFTYRYGTYSVSGNTVTMTFDDTGLATPYTLDPTTTFNVAASANDQFVFRSGTVWANIPSGTNTWDSTNIIVDAEQQPGATMYWTEGLMSWNTGASLGGATVTGCTFRGYCTSNNSMDNRNFTMDWGPWDGVSASDWQQTPGTNAYAGSAITALTLNADNDVTLINAAANVSTSGTTYLRHYISPNTAPTNANECFWASWDHTTATEPRLLVDYTRIEDSPASAYYFLSATASGAIGNDTQENGTAPAAAMMSPAQGWILSTSAVGTSSEFDSQTERLASTFTSNATTPKPGVPDNTTLGNFFRTPRPVYGVLRAGAQALSVALRSTTAAWDGRGRFRWRLFYTPSLTAASPVEITTATQVTSATAANLLTTGNPVAVSGSFTTATDTVLQGAYLFVTLAFEVTTVGTTGTTKDVNLGVGANAALTLSGLAPLPEISYSYQLVAPY